MNVAASDRETKISHAIVAVATAWFTLVAAWELFGPVLAGHYASSASMGIIAENMQRWGIAGPVWSYTSERPTPALYYCHHPWGIFYTTRLFYAVFGRHDFVCRLAPVLLSSVTPALLASTSRAIFRPYAGAVTAVAFVVLPITLSFASFNALEVPVIAWSSLFLWGYVQLMSSAKRRHLVAALVGAFMALDADWPAYLLVGGVLAMEIARALWIRKWSVLVAERMRLSFFVLTALLSLATLGFYLYLFSSIGKLDDLFGSYDVRSAGRQAPLGAVLRARRYWNELMFTPIAITVGKAYVFVAFGRLVVLRRVAELVPLAVLFMATVQYVVFKQGADIHVFWPHYFAMYFALAMGGLTATLTPALVRMFETRGPKIAHEAHHIALGLVLLPLGFVLRDGVQVLDYARATGGRFNEKGLRIESDGDKVALLHSLASEKGVVGLHSSMNPNWAQVWALGGRTVDLDAPLPARGDGILVADARFLSDAARADWMQSHRITAVGPYWVVRAGEGAFEAESFGEREPGILEAYFVSDHEPMRSLRHDPFLTWEVANHYGIEAPRPATPPMTPEQHRIAHNVAIAAGDLAGAEHELALAEERCSPIQAVASDGTEILCARFEPGAAPTLTLLIATQRPMVAGTELSVASRVVAGPRFSTTMADPVVRESSFPFVLAPSRMKAGFVYSHVVVIRARPGIEVFEAAWKGRGAPTFDGPVEVLRQ